MLMGWSMMIDRWVDDYRVGDDIEFSCVSPPIWRNCLGCFVKRLGINHHGMRVVSIAVNGQF
jgi:hypothetical protein